MQAFDSNAAQRGTHAARDVAWRGVAASRMADWRRADDSRSVSALSVVAVGIAAGWYNARAGGWLRRHEVTEGRGDWLLENPVVVGQRRRDGERGGFRRCTNGAREGCEDDSASETAPADKGRGKTAGGWLVSARRVG